MIRTGALPVNYGVVVFPAFDTIDVLATLDILNLMSLHNTMNLSIVASTLDPVSSKPVSAAMLADGSNFGQSIVPTHTFTNPPAQLDVLLVPGGLGARAPAPALLDAIQYIGDVYPSLQYIIGVCTGATLLARAGVLDGKRATTNKLSWAWATSQGPNVNWVPVARWVTDGNIWTSSGVAASIDGMFAFVGECVVHRHLWEVIDTGRPCAYRVFIW
jgi:transcriptional regulator GlxA family with amidase domain